MTLTEQLTESIAKGSTLTIVYHGGSQPGAKRVIQPIMVLGKKLRARDVSTNQTKLFLLDKVEIVSVGYDAPDYARITKVDNRTNDLGEVFNMYRPDIERLGWLATASADAIRLFDPSAAKQQKYGVVGIRRNLEPVLRITLNGVTTTEEQSTDHPWFVYGPDVAPGIIGRALEPGQSYKYLTKAIRIFLSQATRHAPKHSPTRG
jgi:hypothetical protein